MSELDLHDNVRDDVRIDLLCEDVIALTEHLQLKELECKQLADDNERLREALVCLKVDSIKVINNLVNTGCDEAWSVIKLDNMIQDIDYAVNTACIACYGNKVAIDAEGNEWPCNECGQDREQTK